MMQGRPKRYLFTVISLVAATVVLFACQDDNEKVKEIVRPVRTMVVKAPTKYIMRKFPGKVLATTEAELSFQVPGKLIDLPIREGTPVEKGQLLAKLDPEKYQNKVNETKATYIRAKSEYHRAAYLVKDAYISRTEYDLKRSSYLVAEANYGTAQRDLRDTFLKAPFAGVISKKYVENFEHVRAKQPIYKLQNLRVLDIEINVPEDIMLKLTKDKEGPPPVAIFDTLPDKQYALSFKEVTTEADPETQTYRVVMMLPAPDGLNVLPGMTATIKAWLPDYKSGGASFYLIPSSAVFSDDDKTKVWIVDTKTMTVKKVAVKVSRMSGDNVRVLQGLKTGETLVTAGVHFLRDGQKVKLLNKK